MRKKYDHHSGSVNLSFSPPDVQHPQLHTWWKRIQEEYWITSSRMFLFGFSIIPLMCRYHLLLYLSWSKTRLLRLLFSLVSISTCLSNMLNFSLHSFTSSELICTIFATLAIIAACCFSYILMSLCCSARVASLDTTVGSFPVKF